jgi:hypothetical protein
MAVKANKDFAAPLSGVFNCDKVAGHAKGEGDALTGLNDNWACV